MKRIKLILAVIALIALAGSLWMACDSGSGLGGGAGDDTISGWNGGKRPSGGGGLNQPGWNEPSSPTGGSVPSGPSGAGS
jgi:hypothetical protein